MPGLVARALQGSPAQQPLPMNRHSERTNARASGHSCLQVLQHLGGVFGENLEDVGGNAVFAAGLEDFPVEQPGITPTGSADTLKAHTHQHFGQVAIPQGVPVENAGDKLEITRNPIMDTKSAILIEYASPDEQRRMCGHPAPSDAIGPKTVRSIAPQRDFRCFALEKLDVPIYGVQVILLKIVDDLADDGVVCINIV